MKVWTQCSQKQQGWTHHTCIIHQIEESVCRERLLENWLYAQRWHLLPFEVKWTRWFTWQRWFTLSREPHYEGIIIVSGWELRCAQKAHTSLLHMGLVGLFCGSWRYFMVWVSSRPVALHQVPQTKTDIWWGCVGTCMCASLSTQLCAHVL